MIELLTDPIGPLYLWTWIMVVTILSIPLSLWLTRDWPSDERLS